MTKFVAMKNICAYVLLLLNFTSLSLSAQEFKLDFRQLSWKEGLSQSPIFSLMQDRQGFMWIGSRNGLTRYDGYEFKVYHNNELNSSTSQRDINSILEDQDGKLWLATSGGLYRFSKTKENFTKINIPGIRFTSSLFHAGNNNIWITTDKGIKILDCRTSKVNDFISYKTSGLFVHTIYKDAEALGGYHADSLARWSEEYQEWYYKEQVAMLRRMPNNFIGISPWILNDFRSPKRNNPQYQRGWNNKGIFDQKGNRKKAFFILKRYYEEMAMRYPQE